MRPLLVVVMLVGFASAAPVPKGIKKDHTALLVGTWKPTRKGCAWFQFDADGSLKTWHDTAGSEMRWNWTADPEAGPNRVRLVEVSDRRKYDCVFQVDGDGMKFVFILTAGKPPPERWEDAPDYQLHETVRQPATK